MVAHRKKAALLSGAEPVLYVTDFPARPRLLHHGSSALPWTSPMATRRSTASCHARGPRLRLCPRLPAWKARSLPEGEEVRRSVKNCCRHRSRSTARRPSSGSSSTIRRRACPSTWHADDAAVGREECHRSRSGRQPHPLCRPRRLITRPPERRASRSRGRRFRAPVSAAPRPARPRAGGSTWRRRGRRRAASVRRACRARRCSRRAGR